MPKWKIDRPVHVCQMLVVDRSYRLLLIHRSDKVRSAKNVWSLPSGTHDVGESVLECIVRELDEEFSLPIERYQLCSQYENIAGDPEAEEQYHWIISLYAVLVNNLDDLVNNEPDKHDLTEAVHIKQLLYGDITSNYKFHESLTSLLTRTNGELFDQLEAFIGPHELEVEAY